MKCKEKIPKTIFRKMCFAKIEPLEIYNYHRNLVLDENMPTRNGCFLDDNDYSIDTFMMGKYEITQETYSIVVRWTNQKYGINLNPEPSSFKNYRVSKGEIAELRPVENINWYDAIFFCNNLTNMTLGEEHAVYKIENIVYENGHIIRADVLWDKTKRGYRLPTECEWEFAARDCDLASLHEYPGYKLSCSYKSICEIDYDKELENYAWFASNSYTNSNFFMRAYNKLAGFLGIKQLGLFSRTHEVGVKMPNKYGLYDMSGNVHEWVWDEYKETSDSKPFSSNTPFTFGSRIMRGGGWPNKPYDITSLNQWAMQPIYYAGLSNELELSDVGFRICYSVFE